MQMHIFGQVRLPSSLMICADTRVLQSKEADHDLEEELFPAHSRYVSPRFGIWSSCIR